jgi:hypothetical protein
MHFKSNRNHAFQMCPNYANLSIAIATRFKIDAVEAITSIATHASHTVFDMCHFLVTLN